jgi:hypothetical protein
MRGVVEMANESLRNIWIKARLSAPPILRDNMMPLLNDMKEASRVLVSPLLPVCELEGNGAGGPLGVTLINVNIARPLLESVLFVDKPLEKRVTRVPFSHYRGLADWPSGDLIIVEATRYLVSLLPDKNAFVMPPFVYHIVDVSGDWEDIRSRFHSTILKKETALARKKYDCRCEASNSPEDFDEFYDRMYVPTMNDRHGDLSSPMSKDEAFQYFSHGFLLKSMRDGEWVSAVLSQLEHETIIGRVIGVRDSDPELIRTNVMYETFLDSMRWSNEHGYHYFNFLGSIPFIESGQFQHKRKWGGRISLPPSLQRRLWLRVRRTTPAVEAFLKENPFLVVEDRRSLKGMVFVDDVANIDEAQKESLVERYRTPGLTKLDVRSVKGLDGAKDESILIPLGAPEESAVEETKGSEPNS